MKKTTSKKKAQASPKTPSLQSVQFKLNHATARSVTVAGTFNEWNPESLALTQMGEGLWAKEILLPPGVYEYRLVVDGAWMSDPQAAEQVPNPYGEVNSVLRVGAPR